MVDWKVVAHLTDKQRFDFQSKRLRSFVKTHLPYHPYYNQLFKKLKIRFSDIKNVDDLQKIPFITKDNIVPTKKNPKQFLEFVLQPNKKLLLKHGSILDIIHALANKEALYKEYKPIHMHFTTGRSANSVPVLYTQHDLEQLKVAGARMIENLDLDPMKDIGVNAFPYAPHLAFWQVFYAAKVSGILTLQSGGGKVMGTQKIMKAIQNMKASTIVFMPGYGYHLIRTAKANKMNFSSVKTVVFGGERVPPGLRHKIKTMLTDMGAKSPRVLATYAFTEGRSAWVECHEKHGYHTYPDMEYLEVVDKNGERVGEGEKGEIVYTSLGWRGSVFLRYRTGDVTKGIYYERCPHCGKRVPRIDGDIERTSEVRDVNLTKIKGSLVNFNVFFPILMGHKDIEEWQVEVRKKNHDLFEVDELVVYIASKAKKGFLTLKKELEKQICDATEVRPEIVQLPLKEILEKLGMETEMKENRIVDSRKK